VAIHPRLKRYSVGSHLLALRKWFMKCAKPHKRIINLENLKYEKRFSTKRKICHSK
jgi:hypothetical protein